jgi:hypothetical protein
VVNEPLRIERMFEYGGFTMTTTLGEAADHPERGPTCPCNLAPLCRHHPSRLAALAPQCEHRLKTHAGWRYTVLAPGTYLWSDPHGQQFLRTPDGTRDVT